MCCELAVIDPLIAAGDDDDRPFLDEKYNALRNLASFAADLLGCKLRRRGRGVEKSDLDIGRAFRQSTAHMIGIPGVSHVNSSGKSIRMRL